MSLWYIAIIALITAVLVMHTQYHKRSYPIYAALIIASIGAMGLYSHFGKMHWYPKQHDPAYIQATGQTGKQALVHWHEIYHYYLGAKYFKELNYYGLYEAILLADQEVNEPRVPSITINELRDLSNPTHPISKEEGLRRARTIYRPNFTDERWREFVSDWRYMKHISADNWPNLGMFDAGFNPPPTWNVIGYTVANLIPLSNGWLADVATWDEVEILTLLDVLLMAIAAFYIFRTFGFAATCAFVVFFGFNFLAASSWISGSFLRIQWFFALIMAVCMLRQERWFGAGFWLGFSVCMRVFPAVFVLGALVWLLYQVYKDRANLKNLIKFAAGGLIISLFLIIESLAMFGLEYWKIFFANIMEHKDMFFVWHIGYQRIAVFDDWVPNQNFWWGEGLNRFREWNFKLQESWHEQRIFQIPITLAILAATAYASTKVKAEEACLLFGTVALFMLSIPANYYYIYLALLPALYAVSYPGWRSSSLLLSVFLLVFALNYIPTLGGDDLTKNYRLNIALFTFILFWVAIRMLPYVRRNNAQTQDHPSVEQRLT